MKIVIFGRTYIVQPDMYRMGNEIAKLLNHDDTCLFYIASNKAKQSDYDTILFVNVERRVIYPVFLNVFNNIVEPYFGSLLDTFPYGAIIEAEPTEYIICDCDCLESIGKNIIKTHRYGYTLDGEILKLCPDLNARFESFSTIKEFSPPSAAANTRLAETQTNAKKIDISRKSEKVAPAQKATVSQSASPEISVRASAAPKLPEAKILKAEARIPYPDGRNLKSYCGISSDSLTIILSTNKAIVVIDKKSGRIQTTEFNDIYKNDLLGIASEVDIMKTIGRCPTVTNEVKAVRIADLRHVMRHYEKRKDDGISKQMLSVQGGILYVAIIPNKIVKSGCSIKNCAIELHKNADGEYDKMRNTIKAYNSETYLINARDGSFFITAESNKSCKVLPIDVIYNQIADASSLGDIMASFPDRKIVDGDALGVKSSNDVVSITHVSERVIELCPKKVTVRDTSYAYDPASKTIMYTISSS